VVDRLTRELDVDDREKVRLYYHDMESGRLPSEGVSDRVLGALGRVYEWSAGALRAAGRPLGAGGAGEQIVYARSYSRMPPIIDVEREYPEPEEWDEVDELFLGRSRS
jgi:hypothetical protein